MMMPVERASSRSVGSKCDRAEGRLYSVAMKALPRSAIRSSTADASPGPGPGQCLKFGFAGFRIEGCRTVNVTFGDWQSALPLESWTTACRVCEPRSMGLIVTEPPPAGKFGSGLPSSSTTSLSPSCGAGETSAEAVTEVVFGNVSSFCGEVTWQL